MSIAGSVVGGVKEGVKEDLATVVDGLSGVRSAASNRVRAAAAAGSAASRVAAAGIGSLKSGLSNRFSSPRAAEAGGGATSPAAPEEPAFGGLAAVASAAARKPAPALAPAGVEDALIDFG